MLAEEVASKLAESLREGREKLARELEDWKNRQLDGIRAGDNVNALRFARLEELITEGQEKAETWRTVTGAEVKKIRETQLTERAQCDKHEELLYGKQGRPGIEQKVETHHDRFRYMLIAMAIIGPMLGGFVFFEGDEIKARGILNRTDKELAAIIDARIWRAKNLSSKPTKSTTSDANPPDPDS